VTRSGLGTLSEGQKVSFDVEDDNRGKGPKAVNLTQS
jgi:cold shock protein